MIDTQHLPLEKNECHDNTQDHICQIKKKAVLGPFRTFFLLTT